MINFLLKRKLKNFNVLAVLQNSYITIYTVYKMVFTKINPVDRHTIMEMS